MATHRQIATAPRETTRLVARLAPWLANASRYPSRLGLSGRIRKFAVDTPGWREALTIQYTGNSMIDRKTSPRAVLTAERLERRARDVIMIPPRTG